MSNPTTSASSSGTLPTTTTMTMTMTTTTSSNHTLILNDNNTNRNVTIQPVTGAGTIVGAVAAIALPSGIAAFNATTVNDTLNSAASAAFSDPSPEPVDYSPVTQLTAGEWTVVGMIFSMMVLVTGVILWQACVEQRRRKVVKRKILRQLGHRDNHNDDDDDHADDNGDRKEVKMEVKARDVAWEVTAADGGGVGDGNGKALGEDGSWLGGGRREGVLGGKYVYRLSHAVELIRHK